MELDVVGIPVGAVDIGFQHSFEIGDVVHVSAIEDLVGGYANHEIGFAVAGAGRVGRSRLAKAMIAFAVVTLPFGVAKSRERFHSTQWVSDVVEESAV